MSRFLNTTARLALIAALALPHHAMAQQAQSEGDVVVEGDAAELLKKKLEEEAAAEAARLAEEEAAEAEAEAAQGLEDSGSW